MNAITNQLCSTFRAFCKDTQGATLVVFAVTAPLVIGAMALASEASNWVLYHRQMQNAADSAAIAAATNGGSTFAAEAKAVTAQYGFIDGVGGVTVTVTNSNTATGCTSNCYRVTIANSVPLYLAPVVGFVGNMVSNGSSTVGIGASSVANSSATTSYCLLALATGGAVGIQTNGAPKANLACNLMSNTSATCNGHNLGAPVGSAHGTNSGCGVTQQSNVPVVIDPYSGKASAIPSNTCSSYALEPTSKKGAALPAQNQWSGTYSLVSSVTVCGDLQLTSDTTISGSSGTVIVIENGQLDTNGYTLTVSNVPIIFSGTNSSSYQHVPTGGGTLNLSAPSSGTWAGVAMYQDPALTTNVNVSAAGNSPGWNISGLVYMPHASITFSGAVGKSTSGLSCMVFVVDNITINGTGSILTDNSQCTSIGLTPPVGGSRGSLVN